MSKKKDSKKLQKFLEASDKKKLQKLIHDKPKSKCCEKFKKGEHKRCKRCPCYDLLKKVA